MGCKAIRNDYLIQYGESFAGKLDLLEPPYVETNLPQTRQPALASSALTATHLKGPFTTTLSARYKFDNFKFVDNFEVWGDISNLLDRDPPIVGGGTGGTNPTFYDTVGRYFRVGFRAKF